MFELHGFFPPTIERWRIVRAGQAPRNVMGGGETGTDYTGGALVRMSEKRLSKGGDKVVLADAAKAEKKLPQRGRQLPALALFLVIALAFGAYRLYVSL
jgi:hypothetical protein